MEVSILQLVPWELEGSCGILMVIGFGGFSERCNYGSVIEAELLALQVGLQYAWEQNHRCILCETDSPEVIHLLKDERPISSSVGVIEALLGQVKVMLKKL
ncbi:Ribonuclease H-like superfamily [Sesbania bispinosa]|nr:Ribonuclease H-like superfamily [Sesbania bispinosa]